MGKALKPEKVLFTRDLPEDPERQDHAPGDPRDATSGKPAGDVSSLENPGAIAAIAEAN